MVIYGSEIEVKIGVCIRPENWPFGSRLIASDWDQAEFRLPRPNALPGDLIQSLAVNVVITGRRMHSSEMFIGAQLSGNADRDQASSRAAQNSDHGRRDSRDNHRSGRDRSGRHTVLPAHNRVHRVQ